MAKPLKQAIDISFAQGLDTKTDAKRVPIGKFLKLVNMIFDVGQRLTKRNGYGNIPSLPDSSSTYLTTYKDNLTAVGTKITALNASNGSWVQKGSIQPLSLSTLPLLRNNLNQTSCDSVIAPNGLICTAYIENNGGVFTNKYVIANSITGQNIIAPSIIPVTSGTVSGGMRVFFIQNNFLIVFTNTVSGTPNLQYIRINSNNPISVSTNTVIASSNVPSSTVSWDGVVAGNTFYVAYDISGPNVEIKSLNSSFVLSSAIQIGSGYKSTMMSVTADITGPSPFIYVSFYDSSATNAYTALLDQNINVLMNPVQIFSSVAALNLTSAAQNGSCKIFWEVSNAYVWDNSIPTNFINSRIIIPQSSTFLSVFSSGASSITVSSAAGLVNGMVLVDNSTPANIQAGTTFTVSGTTLTLSHNTAGNSASTPGDTLAAATLSSVATIIRSVGLASKAFIINKVIYFLSAYSSPYQPTYFLVNGNDSLSSSPIVIAKLAYENGGGYLTTGLPSVTVTESLAQVPYLFKDLISAVNKGTAVAAGTQVNGIYSQTGINLANFLFGTQGLDTAEIGNDLHLSGGFLSMYDGQIPVEHNFFLWPDTDQNNPTDTAAWTEDSSVSHTATFASGSNQVAVNSASGVVVGMSISDSTNPTYIPAGTIITAINNLNLTISNNTIHAGSGDTVVIHGNIASKPDGATNTNAYFYQFTYEWTDNQGNAFRSAPSIPVPVTTTSGTNLGLISLNIPMLRLTYKIASPVKIVIYRWSIAQPIYYQITSITSPILNDTTIDSVINYPDVLSDAQILGNNILYTTGGVVEDVNAPASNIMTLFDNRLWLVDAEDPNLLWFSKEVIESTPVEMSDLFTFYVAPTTAAQGPTGPITAANPMDDKLCLFKRNSILYINGTGPDNTGANNQYSQPIFITSTVGCTNQQSIVFIPNGLMFQSDKGIWLLGRDLSTSYIGAPVQAYNNARVESAQNIPGTNQVRFILDVGITLMYDYYYDQWGTFSGVPAISSCIYQNLHTFINSHGQAFQETPGIYLDGSNPVLLGVRTGHLRLGDLQNYQRSYFYYLLGQYISPHKLYVSNYYDYSDSPEDSRVISPTNNSPKYGDPPNIPYGQNNLYGGPKSLESWRVFAQRKCMALSIEIQEIYDPSFGVAAGAGLTLSGISLVVGMKSTFRTQSSAHSVG